MQSFVSDNVVAFDVDETLILWDVNPYDEDTIDIDGFRVKPHKKHIEELKRFKARGQFVIVWSAGGAEWAKKAVEILKLEEFVGLVMCKPRWYFDDLDANTFMTRIYRDPT